MNDQPTLDELRELARAAGQLLMSRFGQPHDVRYKGAVDLVTEADHLSETFLLDRLAHDHPTHHVLSEESGSNQADSEHVWIIDPLDGTVNYAHGIPLFSVSIAYEYRGTVLLGVVYDPARDECYAAEAGKGAWQDRTSLHVSDTRELIQALLVTGFPYEKGAVMQRNLAHHNQLALLSRGVRRFGSAALDLCYVASGRFDGYWELSVNPWDVAAGSLIAREAGARVTAADGGLLKLGMNRSILAANPDLHAILLHQLQEDEIRPPSPSAPPSA